MFALEFVNFQYNVVEFTSKTAIFGESPYGLKQKDGFNLGISSGIIPGDFYGGGILSYKSSALEGVIYRSGDVLITRLPDTTKPPSSDNQPEVIGRGNFWAGKVSFRTQRTKGDFVYGFKGKFIYAKFLSDWGSGGGFDVFGGYLGKNILTFFSINNVLTSPVIWGTGKKEFALPEGDLRVSLRNGIAMLCFGGAFSPDGRGFKLKRDGFVSLSFDTPYFAILGGFLDGFPRLGVKVKRKNYSFSLGSSYQPDFGFSFRGDFEIEL
ncbi:MAG: hypothetical protein ABIL16_04420 [candidate division WOR-3 bacterium]